MCVSLYLDIHFLLLNNCHLIGLHLYPDMHFLLFESYRLVCAHWYPDVHLTNFEAGFYLRIAKSHPNGHLQWVTFQIFVLDMSNLCICEQLNMVQPILHQFLVYPLVARTSTPNLLFHKRGVLINDHSMLFAGG